MAIVTIKLAPTFLCGEFYFTKNGADLARRNLNQYTTNPPFVVMQNGEDAAEEVFDLTNNPCRQDEHESVYGGKPVSVGDIVEVDCVNYLCASNGWSVI